MRFGYTVRLVETDPFRQRFTESPASRLTPIPQSSHYPRAAQILHWSALHFYVQLQGTLPVHLEDVALNTPFIGRLA